ncbi:MAG: hypothetical protein HGB21_04255 [Nitrospirae bacterium]|nr:hypothetical protein [Nitrospirota bacterium]NTW65518.1 hypothetical protein [Nitrospirota bacterium]
MQSFGIPAIHARGLVPHNNCKAPDRTRAVKLAPGRDRELQLDREKFIELIDKLRKISKVFVIVAARAIPKGAP